MEYIGKELELFEKAKGWKRYISSRLQHYIVGKVLEVGAGIGSTSPYLFNASIKEWTYLETDESFATFLQKQVVRNKLTFTQKVVCGTIDQFDKTEQFDTIIYIDVLEHIENDEAELKKAAELLNPCGDLIVLCPAFQFLYNSFDRALGHNKRYVKKDFHDFNLPMMKLIKLEYLDTMGFFTSLTNKLILNQTIPTIDQIKFWDAYLIPVSKIIDPLFLYSYGKSVVCVWKKSSIARF